MQPGEEIEIETRDAHDRIVGVVLVWDGEIRDSIPQEGEIVVARVKASEDRRRGCEERRILYVRVVFLCHSAQYE